MARVEEPAHDQSEYVRSVRRFKLFWTVVLYVSVSFALYGTYQSRPETLRGWNGVLLVGLLLAFLAIYHWFYIHRDWQWPMPPREALVYFSTQIVLLFVLSRISPSFGWLSWAIVGHITSSLRPQQWAWPLVPTLLVQFAASDVMGIVRGGDWFGLLLNLFSVAVVVSMIVSIWFAFRHRFILMEVVAELAAAKRALEDQSAQAEELAALRERTRLAREMHDNIGHALVVINVKLEAAQRLYEVDQARGQQELDGTKALVRDTMAELRRSLAGLRAPLHEHQDLSAALRRMADDFRATSQLVVTYHTDNLSLLTPEASEALWRLAREALSNVQRHAQATHVRMVTEQTDDAIRLRIDDDGVGIPSDRIGRAGHYGIVGMRERMEALGGTLSIERGENGGTSVRATLPLDRVRFTEAAKETL